VILLWGLAEDPPLAALRDVLVARGTEHVFLEQRADRADQPNLKRVHAAYIRPYDYGDVPQVSGDASRLSALRHFAHDLTEWLEAAPIPVINRFSAQASNTSKLFQQRLIAAYGFDVPPSLVTTDPQAARAFAERHGDVIYKSLSSVRSIVKRLDHDRLDRLDAVACCPTLFQRHVPGTDYRVHVAGDRVFATMVHSLADDYRYDHEAERIAVTLPSEVAARCVMLSHGLGLLFSGVDLRRTPDGRWCCFEVNPSPAYPYYEPPEEPVIAEALADLLSGRPSGPDRRHDAAS
jgi:glutathione synthase/RimK-type ligase-like ATP-grasp enzyme